MKKVIKKLENVVKLAGEYLTGDEDDPMEDIYKWTSEAMEELKKIISTLTAAVAVLEGMAEGGRDENGFVAVALNMVKEALKNERNKGK
jgi:hypothetical protein